jgi:hypothetical protein
MRRKAFLGFLAVSCGWLAGTALGQETHSADSLMAAFEKGSQISLKGVEIAFSGVVTEATFSRVMFKSSRNDRVICELVSAMRQGNPKSLVGNHLTVVGKVRGRGMLGNVTLDQCRLAATDAVPAETAKAVLEESPAPETSEEPFEGAPDGSVAAATAAPESTSAVADAVSTPPQSLAAPVKAAKVIAVSASADRISPAPPAPSNEAVQTEPEETGPSPDAMHSNSGNAYWQGVIHTLLAMGIGAGAVFVSVRIRKAGLLRRTAADAPQTPEMRRAALEQLLLSQKGKKLKL